MIDLRGKRRIAALALALAFLTPASTAWAQLDDPPLGGIGLGIGAPSEDVPVSVSAQFTIPSGEKTGRLFITATMKPSWHIYSITQARGGPTPTKIALSPSDKYKLVGEFQASPQPKKKKQPEIFKDVVIEEHSGSVTWYATLQPAPGVDPASLKIDGKIEMQACDPKSCVPMDLTFSARLGKGVAIAEPTAPRSVSEEPAGGKPVPADSASFDPAEVRRNLEQQKSTQSLWAAMALGFVGGILLNLMPCVLPVIGLKVLSFVEQAGRNRQAAFLLNVWYCLGILAVFWMLAALAIGLNLGWGALFQYAGFNVVLAAVVFAMALSFLGVWEIPIPGFLGGSSVQSLGTQEGFAGAFSKGILTTLLATPCTGPFMGGALAWALNAPPLNTAAVFTSVGFGMACPYLLVGAFPGLLAFVPKPGAWMETFKQVMGFVLLATVVYLLTVLQFKYVVPTVGLLFALWAAFWWIGRTPPTAEFDRKVWAWFEAAAFAGAMWIVLFPGIRPIVPESLSDRVWAISGLVDVMQSRVERNAGLDSGRSTSAMSRELPWQPFVSRQSFRKQLSEGKTVLIDFTADWCATCKTLETLYLNTRPVRELVDQYGVVTLKADWTHRDPEVTSMLEILGARQVPVVVVFSWQHPNEPIRFVDGYTQDMLLDAIRASGPSKDAPILSAKQ